MLLACQVVIPSAGNVTMSGSTRFQCPVASNFVDVYNGLYGANGSYPTTFQYCRQNANQTAQVRVLVSTLQYQCEPCPLGTYALLAGESDGQPRHSNAFQCQECPFGGVCSSRTLVPAAGYWGGGSLNVTFAVCPDGYCCTGGGSTRWPCVAVNGCGGHRTGPLCGDCEAGYVEAVGSAECVPVSQCDRDKPSAWTIVVVCIAVAAVLQLAVVSDVWLPSAVAPSGKLKLAIYFLQVRRRVWSGITVGGR